MASRSEADRVLREHEALQEETNALQKTQDELESKPFDAATPAAQTQRLVADKARLRQHTAEQRAERVK